jgi:4-carboxymuconolactone decarboxylase
MTQQERHQQGLSKLRGIAGDQAARPLGDWNEIAPDMTGYIIDFVAGDILSRPGLDPKTRQLVSVAMLCALGHAPDEFKMHLAGALRMGWSRNELVEVLIQAAVFAGFPASLNALKLAAQVFQENGSVSEDSR